MFGGLPAAGCWVLLAGPVRAADAPKDAPVKVVYALPRTVPAVLPYVALDKGFFRDEGLEVEGRMFSSGREALQALLAGQAQLQSVSETPVVHAILQGNDIVTIATVARHREAKLLARKDRGIERPADLKGRRVATLPGTNSDYFMDLFFEKHGIRREKVKLANLNPPEMVAAFAQGSIDAFFAWEPHVHYTMRKAPEVSRLFGPEGLYEGRTTLNMRGEVARARPEIARRATSTPAN